MIGCFQKTSGGLAGYSHPVDWPHEASPEAWAQKLCPPYKTAAYPPLKKGEAKFRRVGAFYVPTRKQPCPTVSGSVGTKTVPTLQDYKTNSKGEDP